MSSELLCRSRIGRLARAAWPPSFPSSTTPWPQAQARRCTLEKPREHRPPPTPCGSEAPTLDPAISVAPWPPALQASLLHWSSSDEFERVRSLRIRSTTWFIYFMDSIFFQAGSQAR